MPTIVRATCGNPLAQPVFRTLVALSVAAAGLMGANAAQAGSVPPDAGLVWELGPPPLPPLPPAPA
ncbi:MAG: hypothetical protein WBM08_00465, partial [Prochlorococcaceae cyanobacterium]